jgi:hypothetical protein
MKKVEKIATLLRGVGTLSNNSYSVQLSEYNIIIDGRYFAEEYEDLENECPCRITYVTINQMESNPVFNMHTAFNTNFPLMSGDMYNVSALSEDVIKKIILILSKIKKLRSSNNENNLVKILDKLRDLDLEPNGYILKSRDLNYKPDLKHFLDCTYSCSESGFPDYTYIPQNTTPEDLYPYWYYNNGNNSYNVLTQLNDDMLKWNNLSKNNKFKHYIESINKNGETPSDEENNEAFYHSNSEFIIGRFTDNHNTIFKTDDNKDNIVFGKFIDGPLFTSDKDAKIWLKKAFTIQHAIYIKLKYQSLKDFQESCYLAYQSNKRYKRWLNITKFVWELSSELVKNEQIPIYKAMSLEKILKL